MEALASTRIHSWWTLTKPGIIFGNAVTGFAGYALAAKGHFNPLLFMATLGGLALIVASACVCNNYIDREMDGKMFRTRNRALASGAIPPKKALLFGSALGLLGSLLLAAFSTLLALSIALFGFLVYVFCYSPAKYRSVYGTLIGSVAGAIPPVVGYTAVTATLDGGALILFAIIVFWQMPHFYAIAIYRLKDYAAASIPVLPVVQSLRTTKIHMILYVAGFIAASSLLTLCGYTGILWLTLSTALGLVWLCMALQGLTSSNDTKWARSMFLFSLIIIMAQSLAIPFSTL